MKTLKITDKDTSENGSMLIGPSANEFYIGKYTHVSIEDGPPIKVNVVCGVPMIGGDL